MVGIVCRDRNCKERGGQKANEDSLCLHDENCESGRSAIELQQRQWPLYAMRIDSRVREESIRKKGITESGMIPCARERQLDSVKTV